MKNIILIIIGLLTLNFCWSQEIDTLKTDETFYLTDFSGSIINLISTPEKFNNERVRVIGYLNLEFEGNAIYLHKEDYKKSITYNSLSVSFTKKTWEKINKFKINRSYVIIEGTFDMDDKGHMGLCSGSIKNITRIDLWD